MTQEQKKNKSQVVQLGKPSLKILYRELERSLYNLKVITKRINKRIKDYHGQLRRDV